jgi:hypothetical protein
LLTKKIACQTRPACLVDSNMSGQPLHHPGNSNRRRRVCPPQGLTALSGNTSDASDTVCACRPGRVLQARTKCRRLDVCTTYRRQLFCCFSLPLLRENAGCDGESGREISSGVCLLISRTQRLVFGLTVAWGWRRAGGDASEPCKSFAGRASRGPCACACAVLRRSLGAFFVCRRAADYLGCAGFVSEDRPQRVGIH